jgi:lipase ATG15
MNAPAVKRYARNLFGSVPNENPVLHYGTAYDPIFTGKCNGRFSQCYLTAYAMDAVVHTGKICTFPKQGGDSWLDLRYHTISQFISKVLIPTLKMPECVEQKEEEECSIWEYH